MFQLLDYEPRASEQVPLLLTMSSTEAALRKSIESGDTDLGESIGFNFGNFTSFLEYLNLDWAANQLIFHNIRQLSSSYGAHLVT